MRFKDRKEAGQGLARLLIEYKNTALTVYALPRGGVVVGYEVAKALNAPLDVVITRKIGHPFNPEYAVCALAEDGHMVCNESERGQLDPAWLKTAAQKEQQEARRRREKYVNGRSPLPARGKVALVVDDGVATGLTLELAILEVKHLQPSQIIASVPVIPRNFADRLKAITDQVVAVIVADFYLGSVGAYYDSFPQVEDEEVINLLNQSQKP